MEEMKERVIGLCAFYNFELYSIYFIFYSLELSHHAGVRGLLGGHGIQPTHWAGRAGPHAVAVKGMVTQYCQHSTSAPI